MASHLILLICKRGLSFIHVSFKGYPEYRALEPDDCTLSHGTKRAATEIRSDFVQSSSCKAHSFHDFVPSSDSLDDVLCDARACACKILEIMEPEAAGGAFVQEGEPSCYSCSCIFASSSSASRHRVFVTLYQEPTSAGNLATCTRTANAKAC